MDECVNKWYKQLRWISIFFVGYNHGSNNKLVVLFMYYMEYMEGIQIPVFNQTNNQTNNSSTHISASNLEYDGDGREPNRTIVSSLHQSSSQQLSLALRRTCWQRVMEHKSILKYQLACPEHRQQIEKREVTHREGAGSLYFCLHGVPNTQNVVHNIKYIVTYSLHSKIIIILENFRHITYPKK